MKIIPKKSFCRCTAADRGTLLFCRFGSCHLRLGYFLTLRVLHIIYLWEYAIVAKLLNLTYCSARRELKEEKKIT